MKYVRPAVESRVSVEAELLQFLNSTKGQGHKGPGGKGSMS